ncbi:hypothetical protein ACFY0G_17340 [Streptomyces sp. NPDC001552]|uniref:hypothetical protein n=1 Tax=Streptomyces sp. NPDC001552 TaxID=3364587 RepID=UPI0036A5D00F
MPPRPPKRTPAPAPKKTGKVLAPGQLLDWGHGHWSEAARPCRHCGASTHLRDDDGRAACKVCAETVLADISVIVRAQQQGELGTGA